MAALTRPELLRPARPGDDLDDPAATRPLRLEIEASSEADAQHSDLRALAYQASPDIAVGDQAALLHTFYDLPGTHVLGLWRGERLEATLAFSPCQREIDTRQALQLDASLPDWQGPAAILGRAASRPTLAGQGLMSYLIGEAVRLAAFARIGVLYAVLPSDTLARARTPVRQGWQAQRFDTAGLPIEFKTSGYTLLWLPESRYEPALRDAAQHRLADQVQARRGTPALPRRAPYWASANV